MTKILVATEQGQGVRDNDFCWVPEGEPLRLGIVCNRDEGHVDGSCGCARRFTGLFCHKATTTALVRDWPVTPEGYLELVYGSIQRAGFVELMGEDKCKDVGADWTERILDFCNMTEEGTIVEMRHEGMMMRQVGE